MSFPQCDALQHILPCLVLEENMHPMYHRQVYINDILDITYNILIRNLRAIPTMLNLVD